MTTTSVELRMKEKVSFKITTNLVGRGEEFRLLALAHSTGLPILFLGEPGVGKTQLIRDYALGFRGENGKVFSLEVDPFMRSAEVKGRPNMAALVDKDAPRYEILCPIADVDFIMINEIDKASGDMRNSMLSIMAEHKLFTGVETIDLPYQCFAASCNEIPKDERGSPFWDRFMLKRTVNRMSQEQIIGYYSNGGKDHTEEIEIVLPSHDDLAKVSKLSTQKVFKLVQACYRDCSDRTMTFLPTIVKAISYIWNCSIDKAMTKAVEILISSAAAKAFGDQINTKEMQNILNRLDMLPGISDAKSLSVHIDEIKILVRNGCKSGKLNKDEAQEVEDMLNTAIFEKGLDPATFNS